ncbi:hypothetical protein K501DRAFT_217750 [Backusella circina FSU 941]|nr:hypothetical protein K501DRAFT_217750 [Backusella circina FSU 941]
MKGQTSPVKVPPLNLSSINSSNEPNANSKQHDAAAILEAAHTILFTALLLQRTIGRCLNYTNNESLSTAFSPILLKTRQCTDKLSSCLDTTPAAHHRTDAKQELIQSTAHCINALKELCMALKTRLSILAQALDAKFSRSLLSGLYTATVDIKEAWETISPYLTVDPVSTLVCFMQPTNKTNLSSNNSKPMTRNRSHSEFASPVVSPIMSPNIHGDNSQLYSHLKSAVAGSLHVLSILRQTIEETTVATTIPLNLEKRLNDLTRHAQSATDLSLLLEKNLNTFMNTSEDEALIPQSKREASRKLWEDTSIYLKAIVTVMSLIRSISTGEDFVWPKSIKQGCLHVTRMTAEVAKLWNNYSTFAEEGFFLGRQEKSNSISEGSPSPGADIRRNLLQ